MRTQSFLNSQLQDLLEGQFADMPRPNRITIAFGRRAQRRFGSIRLSRDKKTSYIIINGIFRKEEIPEEIIRATIAHELCHYAHGFCSPLPKLYKQPHQGGIIHRELKKRGLGQLHEYEKIWSKNNWPKIVAQEFGLQLRARSKVRRTRVRRNPRLLLKFSRRLLKYLESYQLH